MDSTTNRLSSLSFAVERRLDVELAGGAYKTARTYLDFVIDGFSLAELTGAKRRDQVSFLATGFLHVDEGVRRLLLEAPADLPHNRRSIYVCPECGDLGCGAITIEIFNAGDRILWRNFGYENNWEDNLHFSGFEHIGPFTFQRNLYREKLLAALEKLNDLNSMLKNSSELNTH